MKFSHWVLRTKIGAQTYYFVDITPDESFEISPWPSKAMQFQGKCGMPYASHLVYLTQHAEYTFEPWPVYVA